MKTNAKIFVQLFDDFNNPITAPVELTLYKNGYLKAVFVNNNDVLENVKPEDIQPSFNDVFTVKGWNRATNDGIEKIFLDDVKLVEFKVAELRTSPNVHPEDINFNCLNKRFEGINEKFIPKD